MYVMLYRFNIPFRMCPNNSFTMLLSWKPLPAYPYPRVGVGCGPPFTRIRFHLLTLLLINEHCTVSDLIHLMWIMILILYFCYLCTYLPTYYSFISTVSRNSHRSIAHHGAAFKTRFSMEYQKSVLKTPKSSSFCNVRMKTQTKTKRNSIHFNSDNT